MDDCRTFFPWIWLTDDDLLQQWLSCSRSVPVFSVGSFEYALCLFNENESSDPLDLDRDGDMKLRDLDLEYDFTGDMLVVLEEQKILIACYDCQFFRQVVS